MSLSKLYTRIDFENNTTPALNETNLNLISKAVDDIDDRVIQLGGDVLETVPQIQAYLAQADDLVEAMQTLSQNPPYIGANGNWYVWSTVTSSFVDSGVDASITVDIADVTMLAEGASPYITNTGSNTDPVFHLYIPVGATGATGATPDITMTATADATSSQTPTVSVSKSGTDENPTFAFAFSGLKGATGATGATGQAGATGNGIASIALTSGTHAAGTLDTYTVTYTDGTTTTFQVYNGADGSGAGDMLQSDYDSDGDVKTAGGIKSWVTALGYITGLAWSGVTSKPFSTVGSGLTVSGDALTADVRTIALTRYGTASSTVTSYQKLNVNGSATSNVLTGSMYMEQTKTLSTSSTTTYTFTNSNITTSSAIDVYTDIYGVNPSSVSVSSGTCTVVFPKYSSASSMACRIYIK